MPQVQSGQVTPGQDGAPALYDTQSVQNTIPFQERLMNLFQPQDFVTIKNITPERVYWQYLPSHAEEITHEPGTMMKTVMRKEPEMWYIEPGATETLVGASAYMALDVMYKNASAQKVLGKLFKPEYNEEGTHVPKNFNFADGGAQEAFIKQAYLGKATPSFGTPASLTEQTTALPVATPAFSPDELKQETVEKAKELTNAHAAKA